MARFVFPSPSHSKPLFWVVCITACLSLQAPLALAQRGAHFGGGGRFAAGPQVTAPHAAAPHFAVSPSARAAIPPFRFSGRQSLIGFRASGFPSRTRPIRPRPVLPIVPFPVFF